MTSRLPIEGRVVWQGEDDFESARQRALWNLRTPNRAPDVIVTPISEQDVAAAVRFAHEQNMRVAIKSGGHNLSGACLRQGGMLLDLSQLGAITIDESARTASVEPAVTSRALADALASVGLAFPVGHCGSVPMGGYLLSGGLGWNMSQWGLACMRVDAAEVVTADGSVVTASEDVNPDLFWAARGAGSGFFGVVTRFHLRLEALPGAIKSSTYVYPLADVEEVSAWARDIAPALPASVEMLLHLVTGQPGAPAGPAGKAVVVAATAFADDGNGAAKSLAVLETCPAVKRAFVRQVNELTSFAGLHDILDQRLPVCHRYIEDALWSSADYSTVVPRLAERMVGAPSPKSLVMAVMPPPRPEGARMPDVAFSMMGPTFVLCYAIWNDAADDARNKAWHRGLVDSIRSRSIGRYIAEANLDDEDAARESFAAPAWDRLMELKRGWDPDKLFYGFLGADEDMEEAR